VSVDAFLPEGAFEQGLDWLTERRAAALADFKAAGLPTRKTEHWKYTPIRALTKRGVAATTAASPLAIEGATVVSGSAPDALDLGKGAFLAAFRDLTDAQRALVEPRLATLAATENHAFAALNTALLSDGIALYLPRNVQVDEPIVIEWSTAGADVAPRLLVIAETGSQATIFEHFEGGPNTLTNAVTEVFVGANAAVHHAVLQTEHVEAFHIGRVEAQVDRDGRFHHGSLNLGAKLARREIRVRLDGAGAETQLHGLFAGHADQHLDQHVHVEHAASRATSNQQFRGILTDTARGVFTGRVLVPDGVKHSTAEQQNPNLLLSETAHVDTRPQLEIYNNDVVASHGATVGRLDADALFYLQARGVPLMQARTLLTAAFAADVLDAMPHDALRAVAKNWLHAHVIGAVQ
jgi:Fe-S cluster assembly protein SufD